MIYSLLGVSIFTDIIAVFKEQLADFEIANGTLVVHTRLGGVHYLLTRRTQHDTMGNLLR